MVKKQTPSKEEALAIIAELFREYGYHGTSYGQITQATGLGKGSLYHYFPNGKDDIVKAILANIHDWFEKNIFQLLEANEGKTALEEMFGRVESYFYSGRRICLLGAFALGDTKATFADEITHYFLCWKDALAVFLQRQGIEQGRSAELAMSALVSIQGGLVMTHAFEKPEIFMKALANSKKELLASFPDK